jgi:osmoprotectant transport system permease protein
MTFIQFIISRQEEILLGSVEHLELTGISMVLAISVGIPVGIVITRIKSLAMPVVNIVNVIQTIPSLALLGFLIPFLGIGTVPAIIALFSYSILAIIKNTMSGINQVDRAVIEAGKGMGMTDLQILLQIEIPLAMPVIFSGIRIATVACIGIATLCAAIGAGGLGQFIFRGISMVNNNMILAGALPAALMAICFDLSMHFLETKLSPSHKNN